MHFHKIDVLGIEMRGAGLKKELADGALDLLASRPEARPPLAPTRLRHPSVVNGALENKGAI